MLLLLLPLSTRELLRRKVGAWGVEAPKLRTFRLKWSFEVAQKERRRLFLLSLPLFSLPLPFFSIEGDPIEDNFEFGSPRLELKNEVEAWFRL